MIQVDYFSSGAETAPGYRAPKDIKVQGIVAVDTSSGMIYSGVTEMKAATTSRRSRSQAGGLSSATLAW